MMANIYEGAEITMAAVVAGDIESEWILEPSPLLQGYVTNGRVRIPARDHDEEILRLVRTANARHPVVFIRGTKEHKYPSRDPHDELPLLKRGWVYQERLLSPRIIYFGSADIMFECNSSMDCYCQSMRSQVNPPLSPVKAEHARSLRLGADLPDLENRWMDIVEEYSRLGLTFKSDRLPGISGIAKQIARSLENQTYLSGLWETFLLQGLLWSGSGESVRDVEFSDLQYPSWSWVPVSGPIEYKFRNLQPTATVQQTCWRQGPDQIYGRDNFMVPRPCTITLLGSYMEANLRGIFDVAEKPYFDLLIADYDAVLKVTLDFAPDALELESEWSMGETGNSHFMFRFPRQQLKEKVGLFLMGTWQDQQKNVAYGTFGHDRAIYLVVRCQDPAQQTFRRIGIAEEWCDVYSGIDLEIRARITTERSITII
jgi:hypothetical protein